VLWCAVCRKNPSDKLANAGGWADLTATPLPRFQSKMEHNHKKTHYNEVIKLVTFADGAEPIAWPKGVEKREDIKTLTPLGPLNPACFPPLSRPLRRLVEADELHPWLLRLTMVAEAAQQSMKPLRHFDVALLDHLSQRLLAESHGSKGKCHNAIMKTFSEWLSASVGKTHYRTVQSALGLSGHSTCKDVRKQDHPFHVGINETALRDTKRFTPHSWCISMGDGTRIMRQLEPAGDRLIGTVFSPDCEQWPEQAGLPIPQSLQDLTCLINAVFKKECLAHECHLEALQAITDGEVSVQVYLIFPEPHRGNTGFWHWKMWMRFVGLWNKYRNRVVGFSTDSCSTGVSAARILMTPNADIIKEHGATYCGLPDANFQYFAVYLQPREMCGYVPPPLSWYGELTHALRNFRKGVGNKKKTIVTYSEQDTAAEGVVEGGSWASMRYLKLLARKRGTRTPSLARSLSLPPSPPPSLVNESCRVPPSFRRPTPSLLTTHPFPPA
jgi:hypothetical protein